MNGHDLNFTAINIPGLMEIALSFSQFGYLSRSKDNLIYLNIDDDYIHRLFPLLKETNEQINKPAYFSEKLVGAHISVIYPEEYTSMLEIDLDRKHHFKITGTFSADLGTKRYYVLGVESPSLLALRQKYNLGSKLYFKKHRIDLHITIGTSQLFTPVVM